jgi:hypothetical protein
MTLFESYLIVKGLAAPHEVFGFFSAFSGMAIVFLCLGVFIRWPDKYAAEDDRVKHKCMLATLKQAAYIFAFVFPLFTLAPSSREVATIIGVSAVTSLDGASKLPQNLLDAANRVLEGFASEEK